MVPFGPRVLLCVLLMAVASRAIPVPQDDDDDVFATPVGGSSSTPDPDEDDLQELEYELTQAAAANMAARAIKLEQRLEDEILGAAVATLRDPNPERRAARMAELGEMVKRDKRTVESITGLLGASSSAAGTVGGAAGGVVSDIASRGSSAGALVGSLVTSVLGSSSSSASGASGLSSPAAGAAAAADPNAGAFSPLRLLSDSVSTVLRVKFSIFRTLFSLVSGLLGSASGSGAAAAA